MAVMSISGSFVLAAVAGPLAALTQSVDQDLPPGASRVVVAHASEPELDVEVYAVTPSGDGPWPAILFVHGHQGGDVKPGGLRYVERGYLRAAADRGLFAAVVSQPGYGGSDGPADYCGPRSQGAVETALAHLRTRDDVDPERIVLYGYSRGATVAAVVATRDTELAGLILGAGTYDLVARYADAGEGRFDARIKANIAKEAGTSEAALRARSALLAEAPIRVPTLILHGEDDENCPPDQARRLAERLRAAETKVTLKLFAGVGHGIPSELSEPAETAFLAQTAFAVNDDG